MGDAGEAVERAARYLALVDDAARGLVVGLHVVGSAVLDDYRTGSDLDVVGELAGRPSTAELDALAAAHRADPGVEAVYVVAGELAGEVDAVADGPWGIDGVLHTDGRCFQLNPVTWLQLGRHAVTVRGPRPEPTVDDAAVRLFCVRNLGEYWRPTLDTTDAVLAGRPPDVAPDPTGVEWLMLGPSRLWHTIRTGEVVSKTRAGELAARRWPDLAGAVADVLAHRRGEPAGLTAAHGHAAVALGRRVLDDIG
jgi:hypothetical protein